MMIDLKYFWRIIILTASFIFGYIIRGCDDRLLSERVTDIRSDTLTVRDTIRETRPVYVDRTRTDTMLVAVSDTVTVSDTVYMVLDREQRRYHGDRYDAWVSGYRPHLDSILVYPETRYVTRDIISVSSRKCNSIALESSASWCGSMSLTISAEYEHSWRWCYVGAGVGYDVVTRSPYIAVRAGVPILSW